MNVFAYCCAAFEESVERAAGVAPMTCPPVDAESFRPEWVAGQDLIYLDLHGEPGGDRWYGDDGHVALTADQVRRLPLAGATVFAVNCHLADRNSPMLDALLDAGASWVVAGPGSNYGGLMTLLGAGLMGLYFRLMMELGFSAVKALTISKAALKLDMAKGQLLQQDDMVEAARDALGFRLYHRERDK